MAVGLYISLIRSYWKCSAFLDTLINGSRICTRLGFCPFVPSSLQESTRGVLQVVGQAEDK